MKKIENRILLTEKEALRISDCLRTLEALGGSSFDDDFNKDANVSGTFAKKIEDLLIAENNKFPGCKNGKPRILEVGVR